MIPKRKLLCPKEKSSTLPCSVAASALTVAMQGAVTQRATRRIFLNYNQLVVTEGKNGQGNGLHCGVTIAAAVAMQFAMVLIELKKIKSNN